ncbi:MAG: hypothetical protein DRJ32_00260 [Thermoprotei archaeon]|mgnify:CR=1 FL=1|nr:MAG: hypothetical protein DRJ32_00260 [Thermoprotei archaeon]
MAGTIFITGTPGVGKTTVAKLLSKKLSCPYFSIAELAKKYNVLIGYDKERKSYEVDINKLRRVIQEVLANSLAGCNIVIEGHIVEAVPLEYIDKVVVLRLHPLVLERRLMERGYPEAKIKENVLAEILDVLLVEAVEKFGIDKVFEINTTNKNPEEVVEEILKIVEGREVEGYKPGNTDWIKALKEEGVLEKYLLR